MTSLNKETNFAILQLECIMNLHTILCQKQNIISSNSAAATQAGMC